MQRLALPSLLIGIAIACTPPLQRVQREGVFGCEGTFSNVAKAMKYGTINKHESCFAYRSLGWSSIETPDECKEVADIFYNGTQIRVQNPFGEGCTIDNDDAIVFGEADVNNIHTIYCIRK